MEPTDFVMLFPKSIHMRIYSTISQTGMWLK